MNLNFLNIINEIKRKHNFWWVLIIIWLLLITVSVTRIISYSDMSTDVTLSFIIWLNIIRWTIVTASIFLIYKIAQALSSYKYAIFFHLTFSFFFAFIVTVLFTLPSYIYYHGIALNYSDFISSTLYYFEGLVVVVPILYALTIGYYYYNLNLEEYTRETINKEKIEKELIEAKLAVFRSQLDPHFLFNTLQGISTLIEFDRESAKLVLGHLSSILKLMKVRKDDLKIELQEELALIDYYLKIEKIRYPNVLFIEKNVSKNTLPALIPTYSIQLLVENAVKHCISKSSCRELIKISAHKFGQFLQITVENSSQKFNLDDLRLSNGIGLMNIKSRLGRMYKNSKFEISESKLGGLKVQISLPFEILYQAPHYENDKNDYRR